MAESSLSVSIFLVEVRLDMALQSKFSVLAILFNVIGCECVIFCVVVIFLNG